MLSIIIPTLNEENHVGGLLECLAGQSYRNWEAVIVDGDSRDKTANIVRQFAKSHKNVKLVVERQQVLYSYIKEGSSVSTSLSRESHRCVSALRIRGRGRPRSSRLRID